MGQGHPARQGTLLSCPSDDRDPASLVSRLRAEVSRRRLPFTVRTSPALSALAAISGDTLWVAEGRLVSRADVERTVTHEIEAHALPRTRARTLSIPLFAIGTAGGSDDQEGYALWIEGGAASRESSDGASSARATAPYRSCARGADFVSVVRSLREWGLRLEHALRIAERAFRGSHGATPGLGRERVYLEAYLRVGDRLEAEPEDETVLSAGQVALGAVEALRPWARAASQV